jgi:uncharacterized protein
MFRKIVFVLFFIIGLTTARAQESKLTFPVPVGFVNDFANVIDKDTKTRLETNLGKLSRNQSLEIAVVTVKTTGSTSIFDYSLAMAREWKIGSKTKPSYAMLLLAAIDDRKYFTQISKDLETVFSIHASEKFKDNISCRNLRKEITARDCTIRLQHSQRCLPIFKKQNATN